MAKEDVTKKCPKCKEDIAKDATKCKHCGADLRNWFVKHKIITGLLALFVLGTIISAANGGDKANTGSANDDSTKTNNTQQSKKFNIDDIYAKVETGMTEPQVKEIITKDPITCTESTTQGVGTYKLCTYGYVFTDSGSIMVGFMNGQVNNKTKSQY